MPETLHIVPKRTGFVRLLDYILTMFGARFASRNAAKKAIKKGAVQVDGQTVSTGFRLQAGMKISFENRTPIPSKVPPVSFGIIYEDNHLAVVNKPAGIDVSGNKFYTLRNALGFRLKKSPLQDALAWPQPVHRLDYATSGLLLVAKTAAALKKMGKQFENKKVGKRYRAIVSGSITKSGKIVSPIKGK